MTDLERIAELQELIAKQTKGALEVSNLMQSKDERIAELERENKTLRGWLDIGGPFEKNKSVGLW